MNFDFDFPAISICLFSASFLAALYVVLAYCLRILAVGKKQRTADNAEEAVCAYPSVSIIVYAGSDPDSLVLNLPAIMEQDYPGAFEAIVVNEGMSAEVNMAVAQVKARYPDIYLTFTPDEARNLSRRKLGLTLGIKAAKGKVVVITDARAEVASASWLRLIVEPIARNPETEVVLGYGYPRLPEGAGLAEMTRAFYMAADAVAWISGAMGGHPYRGCAYNLAYRRRLFFEAKGFAGSINMKDGDDDAFLSAIARKDNTALQLSADAMAALVCEPYMRLTADDRRSHAFTGRRLYKGSRRAMASGEWGIWLSWLLAASAALTAGCDNALAWILAGFLMIAVAVVVAASWRSALRALRVPSVIMTLPFVAALRPIRNIIVGIASRTSHRHYIWQ